MGDAITTSLWIPHQNDKSPLVKVVLHYVANSWTIGVITGCDAALSGRAVLSMLDLEAHERRRVKDLSASAWIVDVEICRLRRQTSGKLELRNIRFGPSSVPCKWLEHPVEVVTPLNASVPTSRKERRGSLRRSEDLIEEAQALCCDLGASWAIMSDFGRGPSLPELCLKSRPAYVDLRTIFLSNTDFDESSVRAIAPALDVKTWASGWFFSANPAFGGAPQEGSSLEENAWKALSSWARRHMSKPR